ncbi:MAG: DUF1998 domain-containing protein [Gammaproteobacteria bacterium]|nr:DUF1998 domain-containing protein [Gammaproteobacteria bacterium]
MKQKKPIRRSQLISPFGVGAIVNFPNDESLMTAGLDHWPKSFEECPSAWKINEERLQKRLKVTHFRLPPDFREHSQNGDSELSYQKIPLLRFPRWHYCPKCGVMKLLPTYGNQEKCSGSRFGTGFSCKDIANNIRPILIPSRYITVCAKGHIEDFPFMQWVHGDKLYDYENHQLRIQAGRSSSSLSGVLISCSCGASRSMSGSFNINSLSNIGYFCSGHQPWLGKSSGTSGDCGEQLRVVQRGASNVYFPDIKSSIYIPVSGEEKNTRKINKKIDDPTIWLMLTSVLLNGAINRDISNTVAQIANLNPDKFYDAAQSKLNATQRTGNSGEDDISELEYRNDEYKAILEGFGGETTDLFTQKMKLNDYGTPWSILFDEIILVKKLRETRVLAGFSRLLPPDEHEGIQIQKLSDNEDIKWLPAVTVFGEGIFIKFNEKILDEWSNKKDIIKRLNEYNKEQNRYRQERSLEPIKYSAKFILLHTFSHLLINQLSYESGYGSSSIRERIYCDTIDSSIKMSGLLIYTASGDSEGTLGGLVRQGEPDRLPEILHNTIEKAKWCTNDPVCIESSGQGINNSNMAACHSCALIAETSCEHGNRFLDRALLIGKIQDESLGFFTTQI